MKVRSLKIQSFRNIDDLSLDFDRRLTVFLGVNGSGKSSILDSLSTLLSCFSVFIKNKPSIVENSRPNPMNHGLTIAYLYQFLNNLNSSSLIKETGDLDIKNSAYESCREIIVEFNDSKINWSLTRKTDVGYTQEPGKW